MVESRKKHYLCSMKMKLLAAGLFFSAVSSAQGVDDALQFFPVGAAIGLDYCEVPARHSLRDRAVVAATSFVTTTVTVEALKITIPEWRPDDSDRRSFPSGHAARAFMGAEMVREEYGLKWGIGAYAFATGIAALRVAEDRHYLHDVVVGSAIGFAATRIAYFLLPYQRKWFGWDGDGSKMAVAAMPTYQPESKAFSITLTLFR
jgi:membrane-associated phospholipid phosphatase